MIVSGELLKKYNVPGPRYTSYPTVPYWENNPSEGAWLESVDLALKEAHSEGLGSALYLHIPFCQSLCTYCGCNTRITRRTDVGAPYVATLLKEWSLYLSKLGREKLPVSEIHLGGGTPTFLTPAEIETLMLGVFSRAEILPGAEFSLEADPRVTTREHLEVLSKLGFKRLSLGIQDFDSNVQEIVNRVQSVGQVTEITQLARSFGFTSINFDLIYGLPLQTLDSITNTIEEVKRLRPDRIAFYAYAHVPWIKASQRRYSESDLPSGEAKRALYEKGRELLEEAGYREIGMDHFALESDSLWKASVDGTLHRNFMGYTAKRVAPLIGLGVSAIGDSWRAFAQNEKHLETYVRRVDAGEIPVHRGHLLSPEDLVIRTHVLNLMTRGSTDWSQPAHWTQYLADVPEKLTEFTRDGLIEYVESKCQVTEKGRPFLRNICMAFDARLVRKAPETRLFSQTI